MKYLIFLIFFLPNILFAKNLDSEDFESVINSIKKDGYYDLKNHDLYKAAIEGVLNALEEKSKKTSSLKPMEARANELLEPRQAKEVTSEMEGEVSGIGVGIQFDPKKGHQYPELIAIVPEGGAEAAGLKVGDQILKVNNKKVSRFKSFADLVYAIRGPAGSAIKLLLLRNGDVFTENVKRTALNLVPSDPKVINPSTLYFEVGLFNKKTLAKFQSTIAKAKQEKKSLIVDLRRCTGGLFKEGLEAIKLFAASQDVILETKDRKGKTRAIKANSDGIGKDLDVVILTSPETKSIAEAFAGAVRKTNGAMVIGQKTFGKATVESMVELGNGYNVKFTVGEMNINGESTWNKVGITPDIPVKEDEENREAVLEVAQKILKNT